MTTVVTEVSIPSESFELGQILHDPGASRIELMRFVPTGNALVPYFWAETNDHASLAESVRGDDRVASLTEVDAGAGKHLYHVGWADEMEVNGFLELLRSHDLIAESAVGTDDTWRFRLRSPDRASLAAFQQDCADAGIQLSVHRVWNPSTEANDPNGLTVDQREALQVAAQSGYFETPSKATLEQIGAELDISSQAASKRIRGGVEKLVDRALRSAD